MECDWVAVVRCRRRSGAWLRRRIEPRRGHREGGVSSAGCLGLGGAGAGAQRRACDGARRRARHPGAAFSTRLSLPRRPVLRGGCARAGANGEQLRCRPWVRREQEGGEGAAEVEGDAEMHSDGDGAADDGDVLESDAAPDLAPAEASAALPTPRMRLRDHARSPGQEEWQGTPVQAVGPNEGDGAGEGGARAASAGRGRGRRAEADGAASDVRSPSVRRDVTPETPAVALRPRGRGSGSRAGVGAGAEESAEVARPRRGKRGADGDPGERGRSGRTFVNYGDFLTFPDKRWSCERPAVWLSPRMHPCTGLHVPRSCVSVLTRHLSTGPEGRARTRPRMGAIPEDAPLDARAAGAGAESASAMTSMVTAEGDTELGEEGRGAGGARASTPAPKGSSRPKRAASTPHKGSKVSGAPGDAWIAVGVWEHPIHTGRFGTSRWVVVCAGRCEGGFRDAFQAPAGWAAGRERGHELRSGGPGGGRGVSCQCLARAAGHAR